MKNYGKVAVLGMGVTGRSIIDYFTKKRWDVVVWDELKSIDPFVAGFDYSSLDLAVKSPGIPPNHEVVQLIKSRGVSVVSDIDVFFDERPDACVVGVTGTDGKSSVVHFTSEILRREGYDVALGGNFGYPILDLKQAEIYVLELSSYQLVSMAADHPIKVGCITNLAYDHLSYHKTFAGYSAAKERLFAMSKYKVLGELDSYTHELYARYPDAVVGGGNEGSIRAICSVFGIGRRAVDEYLRLIPPLEHRMEVVKRNDRMTIINDSKSTNLHSLIYALDRLGRGISLILGGRTKGEDFSVLDQYAEKIGRIYLIGESTEIFAKQIHKIPTEKSGTLENTIAAIPDGFTGTLLFAPACASFDQFANYESRGREFKRLINERFG